MLDNKNLNQQSHRRDAQETLVIPERDALSAPVFVEIEMILNKVLPKLPNLVSISEEPIWMVNANTTKVPKPISTAAKIETPLPFPKV
jgi:hypothetical protein